MQVFIALFFLSTVQGKSLHNKDDLKQSIEIHKTNVKEEMEQKFNHTVEKVVEAKMFLLGVLAHTFNKTVDKLMETTQQIKELKEDIKHKFSSAVNKTGHKWEEMKKEKQEINNKFAFTVDSAGQKLEEMKQNLHEFKLAKHVAHHPQSTPSITRNVSPVPVSQIVSDVPSKPLAPIQPIETTVEAGRIAAYAINMNL